MSCIVRNIQSRIGEDPPFEIKDISFALKDGQILSILGPSGAGKSSLLNVLAGFIPIQQGAIILDDQTVSCASYCLPPLQRNIGMIFQDHNLLPHISLVENLTLGLDTTEIQRRSKEIQSMLKDLQLSHLQKTLPHQVSGGQQQRIALGRALLHDKKLVLFDEPFSGLDRERMVKLAETMRASVLKYRRSAILVTHHIEEAFLISDMIGIMQSGRLLSIDTPDNIYHEPQSLTIAAYLGPVNILQARREKADTAKTTLGSVSIKNPVPSGVSRFQVLTRPDDFEMVKGNGFTVKERTFMGMSQVAVVSDGNISLEVNLEHYQHVKVGDHVGVNIREDHSFIAYDELGNKIA